LVAGPAATRTLRLAALTCASGVVWVVIRKPAGQNWMRDPSPEANLLVGLEPREKLVVVGVGSDPEPDPTVRFADSESSIAQGDAGGEDRTRRVNLLESETRV
jgi:hypothetical protein